MKGAAASALYGERGLNGVIVITTKSGKGKDDNRWGVTINTGGNFGFVDKSTFPEYQNQYGGGYAPGYNFGKDYTNYNDDASLGPKYDGHMVYFWDSFDPTSSNYGKMRPYVAAQHTPADFFETASNYTNTLSLQKSGDKGSILINYTNQLMTGVLPNSDLRKNTVSAKFDYKLTDKLTATVYSSLTLQDTKGRNETGYSDNIASSLRQWWNTDSDMYLLRDAYNRTGKNVSWNRKSPTNGAAAYWDNPYFQRYQSYQSDDRTRIFSYAMLNYKFSKNVNATAKLSIDNVDLLVENRLAVGSVPRGWGQSGQNVTSGYSKQNIKQQEMNFDLFANYKFDLAEGLDLSGMVGGNVRRNYNTNDYTSTEGGLVVPIYTLWQTQHQLFYQLGKILLNW